jgi:DNA damage-inducible protein 1
MDDERRRREQQEREDRERALMLQQAERMRMVMADPFDMEAQNLMLREIQQQNIESNMETAMEYHPEAYGQVTMLYIKCKVNGHDVKAFVDSGAQSTIMSNACAERCNLTRLIDSRWSGIAKGVGTQRIIGRIHLCQVQIEKDFLASSFTILQDQSMDMLLGLDMLKRHQCAIDLRRNLLSIGTTGTETSFLSEGECPDFTKSRPPDMTDEDAEIADAINRSIQESSSKQPFL